MLPNPLTALDRLDVQELLARYAWAIDTLDVEGYVGVFTPDATLSLRGVRYQGQEEIRNFARGLFARSNFPGRQHHNDQILIEAHPEGAAVRSYSQITQRFDDGSCHLILAGMYLDTCVRREERWLFSERLYDVWPTSSPELHGLRSA
jgi:uncharacterized protein (TIGR02246 family)